MHVHDVASRAASDVMHGTLAEKVNTQRLDARLCINIECQQHLQSLPTPDRHTLDKFSIGVKL